MSELSLTAQMNEDVFSFLLLVFTQSQIPNDRFSERAARFAKSIEEGRGFHLNLFSGNSTTLMINVVFHFRAIDHNHEIIKGIVDINHEFLDKHLKNLAVQPRKTYRQTFAPILETDLTLATSLRFVRNRVQATIVPMPNISLLKP